MSEVTRILERIERGEGQAAKELLPLVYEELRRLAAALMAREKPGHTLQPTALVHAAFLRLLDAEHQQKWDSRGHFFAAAAEAMRRILVDKARRKARLKRGGELRRVDLPDIEMAEQPDVDDLLALEEALTAFEKVHPEKARLVNLRYFAGLSEQQAADVLGISRATAARHWAFARAWLFERIS